MILMDVQMPGMDGLTATRLIRQLGERHRDIPIIAMTANVLSEEIELCIQAGMDDHIGKPFVWNDLLAKMDKLSRRRMTVTNATSP
jgi:CheY-like chemotaxis protein